jgi:hypothetical protein
MARPDGYTTYGAWAYVQFNTEGFPPTAQSAFAPRFVYLSFSNDAVGAPTSGRFADGAGRRAAHGAFTVLEGTDMEKVVLYLGIADLLTITLTSRTAGPLAFTLRASDDLFGVIEITVVASSVAARDMMVRTLLHVARIPPVSAVPRSLRGLVDATTVLTEARIPQASNAQLLAHTIDAILAHTTVGRVPVTDPALVAPQALLPTTMAAASARAAATRASQPTTGASFVSDSTTAGVWRSATDVMSATSASGSGGGPMLLLNRQHNIVVDARILRVPRPQAATNAAKTTPTVHYHDGISAAAAAAARSMPLLGMSFAAHRGLGYTYDGPSDAASASGGVVGSTSGRNVSFAGASVSRSPAPADVGERFGALMRTMTAHSLQTQLREADAWDDKRGADRMVAYYGSSGPSFGGATVVSSGSDVGGSGDSTDDDGHSTGGKSDASTPASFALAATNGGSAPVASAIVDRPKPTQRSRAKTQAPPSTGTAAANEATASPFGPTVDESCCSSDDGENESSCNNLMIDKARDGSRVAGSAPQLVSIAASSSTPSASSPLAATDASRRSADLADVACRFSLALVSEPATADPVTHDVGINDSPSEVPIFKPPRRRPRRSTKKPEAPRRPLPKLLIGGLCNSVPTPSPIVPAASELLTALSQALPNKPAPDPRATQAETYFTNMAHLSTAHAVATGAIGDVTMIGDVGLRGKRRAHSSGADLSSAMDAGTAASSSRRGGVGVVPAGSQRLSAADGACSLAAAEQRWSEREAQDATRSQLLAPASTAVGLGPGPGSVCALCGATPKEERPLCTATGLMHIEYLDRHRSLRRELEWLFGDNAVAAAPMKSPDRHRRRSVALTGANLLSLESTAVFLSDTGLGETISPAAAVGRGRSVGFDNGGSGDSASLAARKWFLERQIAEMPKRKIRVHRPDVVAALGAVWAAGAAAVGSENEITTGALGTPPALQLAHDVLNSFERDVRAHVGHAAHSLRFSVPQV